MFDRYSAIFDKRGQQYHQAMAEQPNARAEEFNTILSFADLKEGMDVLDVPSGGGYLSNYIESETNLTQIETSKAFYEHAKMNTTTNSLYCEDIAKLPIADQSIDRIVSLAGLHHIEDRQPFYREANRVLKHDGMLCIADVAEGSDSDRFLNVFVEENSTEGHKGLFINQRDIQLIENSGFEVNKSEVVEYSWRYGSIEDMVDYTGKLFGINQCTNTDILSGIEKYLGYRILDDQVVMNWSLCFIQAKSQLL